jgi:DNA-binding LacI/PurR family transcriptional regulator
LIDKIYDDIVIKNGDFFLILEETDLVNFITQVGANKFLLGKDIGVLSYNDSQLKDLFNISVVTTNFKVMGGTTAKMILNKEKVPFNFIDRKSM